MFGYVKKLICTAIALCVIVPGITVIVTPSAVLAAGIVNSNSPFIDDTDPGAANEVNVIGTDKQQEDSLVNVIKGRINRVLGIMALVALIVVIYGGILMVTSAGAEDQYKKGITILRQAVIGLLLIGVAWFIVSIVFWLINQAAIADQGGPGTDT